MRKIDIGKLHPWMIDITANLMKTAENAFPQHTGNQKKAWVKKCLNDALDTVDVKKIPNWIEDPLKDVLVDFLIEILWNVALTKKDRPAG